MEESEPRGPKPAVSEPAEGSRRFMSTNWTIEGSAYPVHQHFYAQSVLDGTVALPTGDEVLAAPNQLLADQAYYNELYLLAPVGHFVLGFDTTILQANLVGAELLGMSRNALTGQRLRNFVSPLFHCDFDRFIARAINSRAPEQCQLQMSRGGPGGGFPVTLLASADGSGQACRVVVEHAEGKWDAVERNEERFRRIVHSAEEGIWEIDVAAHTSFVNPKMAQLLGFSIEEMLDKPLSFFCDAEGLVMLERNLLRRQQGIAERHEFKFICKDGHALWTTMATNPIYDSEGAYIGALALVTDITDRRESAELIWHQANFDDLTGLPNRHMFMDRLKQETKKATRNGSLLALMFIDLDHFKDVNDRLGHAMGDCLLQEAARRIAACVRVTDTLARLGGDEFTVILSGLDQVSSVERVAQSIINSLVLPFELAGETAHISASVGVALFPPDAQDVSALLDHADKAMYAAKSAGRNCFSYFTPDLQAAAQARLHVSNDLREAIDQHQFEVFYQAIVPLQGGPIHKAEALLRWRHPTRGLLNPADFLPFAESSGLIVEIGDWVFNEAVMQVAKWQRALNPNFQISVNKSPVQFRRESGNYQRWIDHLSACQLAPRSIVVEITESVLLEGAAKVADKLHQYRSMGLLVALDDFGTGYSSLSHLTKFDIDYLKIDQSFVHKLEHNPGDLALCEAIIVMAHKLGLKVIAEGVETAEQRRLLANAGCDYGQGYVFAHPMAVEHFEAMARHAVPRML